MLPQARRYAQELSPRAQEIPAQGDQLSKNLAFPFSNSRVNRILTADASPAGRDAGLSVKTAFGLPARGCGRQGR